MKGVSEAEEKAIELLSEYDGGFISKRDGYVIIKIRQDDKTSIIWIRQTPITREAITLFKKMIEKHEYDNLILLKLYREADYIKYSELSLFNEIKTNI